MTRNEKILSLRGQYSYGVIAQKLGVSRGVVSGVCWRSDWPTGLQCKSPRSRGRNKSGTGRGAPVTMWNTK